MKLSGRFELLKALNLPMENPTTQGAFKTISEFFRGAAISRNEKGVRLFTACIQLTFTVLDVFSSQVEIILTVLSFILIVGNVLGTCFFKRMLLTVYSFFRDTVSKSVSHASRAASIFRGNNPSH